jgi:DNA-binding NarL/FixJ family response regulator
MVPSPRPETAATDCRPNPRHPGPINDKDQSPHLIIKSVNDFPTGPSRVWQTRLVTFRVLLADDQSLVRAGFRALLERAEDIEVVGDAADGVQAVTLAAQLRPDVVLMDIRMPKLDGIEATRQIAADPELHGVRVIVLTTFEHDEYIFSALRAGASGFLIKDIEADELRNAVRVVAGGESLVSPRITSRLIAELVTRPTHRGPDTARTAVLTDREREVVALVARGLSNVEIGRKLFMSPATAKTHASRAMVKVGARDRAQLVVFAYETGLVTTAP